MYRKFVSVDKKKISRKEIKRLKKEKLLILKNLCGKTVYLSHWKEPEVIEFNVDRDLYLAERK